MLGTTGGQNAADLQRSYSEVTEGVGESLSGEIKSLKRLVYGTQAQVGALSARLDKRNARLEGIVKTKTASTTAQEDPKKRMLSGADLRNREFAGRNGQTDNALELKRLKTMSAKEGAQGHEHVLPDDGQPMRQDDRARILLESRSACVRAGLQEDRLRRRGRLALVRGHLERSPRTSRARPASRPPHT